MKTRRISRLLLIILILALSGSVVAYMYQKTGLYNNELVPATVSCSVNETFDAASGIKTSIEIQNTGNIPVFIRLSLVSYWVDSSGKVVAKPSEMPTVTPATGWIAGPNNTYYYVSPVPVNGATQNLLASPLQLAVDDANGYSQVVEVFAEAIQSQPDSAVTAKWGVTVNAVNGTITEAPTEATSDVSSTLNEVIIEDNE